MGSLNINHNINVNCEPRLAIKDGGKAACNDIRQLNSFKGLYNQGKKATQLLR
jgi:hypothetical protein